MKKIETAVFIKTSEIGFKIMKNEKNIKFLNFLISYDLKLKIAKKICLNTKITY